MLPTELQSSLSLGFGKYAESIGGLNFSAALKKAFKNWKTVFAFQETLKVTAKVYNLFTFQILAHEWAAGKTPAKAH